jgi:hypothetical protein
MSLFQTDSMTDTDGHDWVTFHLLRFPEPVSSIERVFPPVAGPDCWLFGPHYAVGSDGMITGVSDIWCGVGIWHSRDAAEAMVVAPGDAMPWLGETVAAWHCLSVPVNRHHFTRHFIMPQEKRKSVNDKQSSIYRRV